MDINKLEGNREHEKNDPLFTLFKPPKNSTELRNYTFYIGQDNGNELVRLEIYIFLSKSYKFIHQSITKTMCGT